MAAAESRLSIATAGGEAWIDLVRPAKASAVVALTHGAGGGVRSADLLAARDALVLAGAAVALITQPYRVAGRSTPPKPGVQDAPWLEILAALGRRRGFASLPLITGGRSNGARLACRTATECGAAGVIALAYPLHPPGKPEISRLDELQAPRVPVLVVQGDRDPFGMPEPAPGRAVLVIEGADHALRKGIATLTAAVVEFVRVLG